MNHLLLSILAVLCSFVFSQCSSVGAMVEKAKEIAKEQKQHENEDSESNEGNNNESNDETRTERQRRTAD